LFCHLELELLSTSDERDDNIVVFAGSGGKLAEEQPKVTE
jgi:hypothetical protein